MYSETQIQIMQELYPDKIISRAKLERIFHVSDPMTIHKLIRARLVRPTTNHHSDEVYLTDEGRAYIENVLKDIEHYKTFLLQSRVAIAISIMALVVSVVALFK